MTRTLFVDFETYYSRKDKYTLSELSVTEYVRDERFKAHGLAYCWLDDPTPHWISGDHVIQAWVGSVDWGSTVVVAHNARFDGSILAWRYGVNPSAWFDTVALAKAVLGGKVSGYSLKQLAEYLGLEAKGELKWDGVRDLTPQQDKEMGVYCKGDVSICRGIYERLSREFPISQYSAVDWTIRAFVEPKLVLNASTLSDGVAKEKERREEAIKASGIEKDVLSSNKKFSALLSSKGYVVRTKISGRTGKEIPAFAKTDDFIESLKSIDPVLYEARIASKANLLETRGESLLAVAKTGPFPFDVGFSGAPQTHRYSGGSGAGGNPQNFTRWSFLRRSVCPPPGHSLIVGDFAAIEARLIAFLANEPKLMSAFAENRDIYAEFASIIYGFKVAKETHPLERQFGKICILGLGYGMGWEHFIETVKVQIKPTEKDTPEQALAKLQVIREYSNEKEARRIVNLYRTTYFNIPRLWENAGRLLPLMVDGRRTVVPFAQFIGVVKEALVLPSGLNISYPGLRVAGYKFKRPAWVYDCYETKYKKETTGIYGGKIIENICQALAGEITKTAIERATILGLRCVGQVHDEILAVSQDPEQGVGILQACMEKAMPWWPMLRLKAEVHHGPNWLEAK